MNARKDKVEVAYKMNRGPQVRLMERTKVERYERDK